ncbi:hypothetical protein [uncultured Pontibacter sp.]|uniref:hypothetical protein n=1 Tax=uncultured Pontibacter sp. TaxID=453356 RepID=UPI002634EE55|nr:hypothetical protein [uncultured Pontibacter sp.]
MIIYKSDCITLTYHEADKLIEATWHTYAASKEYRAALLQYVEALKHYEVRRWLGDYRQARVVRVADQNWTTREWGALFFPHCMKLEKMSRVKATDVSARISFDNMSQYMSPSQMPFNFKEFEEYDAAREWVLG